MVPDRRSALAPAAVAALLAAVPRAAIAAPVEIPSAVAELPATPGQGLCVASAVSTTPQLDFGPLTAGTYNAGMNAFLEAHKGDRSESVLRTIFDLSNNNSTGLKLSYGDFTDSMSPTCPTGGCAMFQNDTNTAFGSRFRGFLGVPPAVAGQPVHIGFYADDAVSLVIYDKAGNGVPILTQPPILGAPTWRLTQEVKFDEPGLYPIEILYVEIVEHAALEMSFLTGPFTDFQYPANLQPPAGDPPNPKLKGQGFTLYPVSAFYQTISGTPSFPDETKCQQCDRQFVGQIGNNGCDAGYYCNEAALCAPCDTAYFCGPSCSPCGGDTPFCINENGQYQCGACVSDSDCKKGFSCDPVTHTCHECNVDADCPRGYGCVEHACALCSTPDQCAGSSCNCCGKGGDGKPMSCEPLSAGGPPECVECHADADCGAGKCDVLVGLCVDALAAHEETACCGDECLHCPAEAPLCLPGPYGTACAACRNDLQCSDGYYCRAGACQTCTTQHRCGPRCEACAGDTPFCLPAQRAQDTSCVRCLGDSDCGEGGRCDPDTHACAGECALSCAPETPLCLGTACVACYADVHCPCGGSCDLASHTCSSSCRDNGACLGDQHCTYAEDGKTKKCETGALPDNADCGGTLADLCTGSSIGARGADPTPGEGILGLSLLALLARRWRKR